MGANGIYGLSGSGLDIESLVKMGMMNKQQQYDKMQQTETLNTWQKEEWATIYDKFTTYKYSTLSDYKMQSNMSAKAAASNNSAVSATANGAAATMAHSVTVGQVSSNAYMMTGQGYNVTRGDGSDAAIKNSTSLADVMGMTYKKIGTVKDSNDKDVNKYYHSNLDGGSGEVLGTDIAVSISFYDGTKETDPKTGLDRLKEFKLELTYDDLFDSEKSLYDLGTAISKTGANIQGSYDTTNDSFSLYNKTGGKDNIIGIEVNNKVSARLMNNLHLSAYDTNNDALGVYDGNGVFQTSGTDKSLTYTFQAENTKPTELVTDSITHSGGESTSLRDMLGLSAKLADNGGGNYTLTMKDSSNNEYSVSGDIDTIKSANAFQMVLDDGNGTGTISFTYGELFNLNQKDASGNIKTGTLNTGKADLGSLADKINSANHDSDGSAMTLTAKYDGGKDQFSLVNLSSSTADMTGSNAVGTQLASALNLAAPATSASQKLNISSLANALGMSAKATKINDNSFTISENNGNLASYNADKNSYLNGSAEKKTAFTLSIGDGTNKADVDISFGELFDFSKFSKNQYDALTYDGARVLAAGVMLSETSLDKFADAINGAGLNLVASYSSSDGLIITNTAGGAIEFGNGSSDTTGLGAKLAGISGVLTPVDTPSGMSIQSSGSITRVNTKNSDDNLKDILGLSAVKNSDGSLTVKDSSGKETNIAAADIAKTKAFELRLADSNNEAAISFTYAELFDTNDSGKLLGNATMDDLQKKINQAGLDLKASYDSAKGSFSLFNVDSTDPTKGGYAIIEGKDDIGKKLVSNLGLKMSDATAAQKNGVVKGTDAEVTIDGKKYNLDSNNITVGGVTYTFNDKTAAGEKATVNVTQDTDKIVDYVKSFVDEYNNMLDYLNDKYEEQRYRDYKPLTKRQEEGMSETQVSKWTEKAKSGMLYHDSTLRDIISQMRETIFTPIDSIDSAYNSAFAIGIDTSTVKGHLKLDEDKLRKALAADPDCVYEIFASDQDSSYVPGSTNKKPITNAQKKLDYQNTGLANRLTNVMTNVMSKVSDHAGTSKETNDQSYLGKLITNLQTRMSTFKTQMTAFENNLYKKYDAMESLLQSMSVQLNYITGYGN